MSSGGLLARRAPALGRLLAGGRGALRMPAPRPRTLAALLAALVLAIAGWFWLRDSSLVAVRHVEVTGVGGTQGVAVRGALEDAAQSMTTLHVRRGALDAAVAPYSIVKRLEVSTGFPHTMRIHVVTNVAVAAVAADGRRIAVTGDGTLLRDVTPAAGLPTVPLRTPPGGARLTGGVALAAVAALGAAPEALRTRVGGIRHTAAHGFAIQLDHGPVLWFGDGARLAAKWAAAAAVLADPASAGASAIDVTVPEHPAVAGLPDGASATGESDVPTPPAATTAGAAPPATATPSTTVVTPTPTPTG